MFVYQKANTVNVVFEGNLPKEKPDMVFGEVDGKATITAGEEVVVSADLVNYVAADEPAQDEGDAGVVEGGEKDPAGTD